MFINLFRSQLLFVCLLWFLVGYGQQLRSDLPENNGMSSERLSNIDNVFTNYIDSQKLPGSVILVARNGKIVYHKSFGMSDMENKVPMTMIRFSGSPLKQKHWLV